MRFDTRRLPVAASSLVGCLLRLRLVGLQRLHPTPDGLQRAAEMRLQLLELLEGVGLGLADDLVALGLRVLHNLRGGALGAAQDLVLGRRLLCALVGS